MTLDFSNIVETWQHFIIITHMTCKTLRKIAAISWLALLLDQMALTKRKSTSAYNERTEKKYMITTQV